MPSLQPTHHPRPSNPRPIATQPHPHAHPAAPNSTTPTLLRRPFSLIPTTLPGTLFDLQPILQPSTSPPVRAATATRRDPIARSAHGRDQGRLPTPKTAKNPPQRYQKPTFSNPTKNSSPKTLLFPIPTPQFRVSCFAFQLPPPQPPSNSAPRKRTQPSPRQHRTAGAPYLLRLQTGTPSGPSSSSASWISVRRPCCVK